MSSLNREYSEKRNFIRMKVDTPAQLTETDSQQTYNGLCHDLSGGGMLLTLDEEVAIDTEFMVTVEAGHRTNPILQARCTVARVEPGPQNTFLLGLEISEIINTPDKLAQAEPAVAG